MKVAFKKTLFKDREHLPKDYRDNVDALVFDIFPGLIRLSDLTSIKKIKGYPGYYRARIGEYRVGFELRDDEIVVHRVLHRREIYRYFP